MVFFYLSHRSYYAKLSFLDPNHKVLRELEELAPGTYYHSLQISVFALGAARKFPEINKLNLKLGAFLHDIGKLKQAEYFTENQKGLTDHFDDKHLDRSREIILNHSQDGLEMAKKYKIPPEIWEFIASHHGTGLIGLYYRLKDGKDKEQDYRYPGPKPQSLAAAILMLADSCEAAIRSQADKDYRQVIEKVFEEKEQDQQLDEVDGLTLEKLKKIKESFIEVQKKISHERVARTERIEKQS